MVGRGVASVCSAPRNRASVMSASRIYLQEELNIAITTVAAASVGKYEPFITAVVIEMISELSLVNIRPFTLQMKHMAKYRG